MAKRKYLVRGVIVLIVILALWVAFISSKQIKRNQRIEREVSLLQTEAEKIRRENETLSEKIGYFSSVDFKEQEAKGKLGMKKTDEAVVVIKPLPVEENTLSQDETTTDNRAVSPDKDEQANFKKWWKLFFQKQ